MELVLTLMRTIYNLQRSNWHNLMGKGGGGYGRLTVPNGWSYIRKIGRN
jgi:hypothetical protein